MKNILLATTFLYSIASVYDPNKAGWKVDGDGKIETKDGNPIYVDSSGRESTLDAGTVSRLNGEARDLRTRAETAETSLKAFEGLDAAKARQAMSDIAKIDQKKLIDAGEVDRVKSEIEGAYKTQITDLQTALDTSNGRLNNMRMEGAFKTSKFINDRVAIPADILMASFKNNFKNENDSLVPYNEKGEKIYSKERIGEVAGFDEAIAIMIQDRPDKDSLLLAQPRSGSGNKGEGGNTGDGRIIKRAEFNTKPPHEQAQLAGQAREGKVKIVD